MTETRLDSLPVGTTFSLTFFTTGRVVRGKLLRLTSCSATVKLEGGKTSREFETVNRSTGEKEKVTIPVPSEVVHWDPGTLVVPVTAEKEGI